MRRLAWPLFFIAALSLTVGLTWAALASAQEVDGGEPEVTVVLPTTKIVIPPSAHDPGFWKTVYQAMQDPEFAPLAILGLMAFAELTDRKWLVAHIPVLGKPWAKRAKVGALAAAAMLGTAYAADQPVTLRAVLFALGHGFAAAFGWWGMGKIAGRLPPEETQ